MKASRSWALWTRVTVTSDPDGAADSTAFSFFADAGMRSLLRGGACSGVGMLAVLHEEVRALLEDEARDLGPLLPQTQGGRTEPLDVVGLQVRRPPGEGLHRV